MGVLQSRYGGFAASIYRISARHPTVLAGNVLCAERDMVREFGGGRRSLLSSWLS